MMLYLLIFFNGKVHIQMKILVIKSIGFTICMTSQEFLKIIEELLILPQVIIKIEDRNLINILEVNFLL